MSPWIGRTLVLMGGFHLALLGLRNTTFFDEWVRGQLWGLDSASFIHPSGAAGAYWITLGSFAVPLMLLGALIAHLAKRGVEVPASVGWGLLAWVLIAAAILAPTPMPLVLIPAALIIRRSHAVRRRDAQQVQAAHERAAGQVA